MTLLNAKTVGNIVPQHVAFIMDGNRRWAYSMGHTDASIGHRFGATRGEEVLGWCRAANIYHVTVYVASLDNLRKRCSTEINCLMTLIEAFVEARLKQRDCCLHVAGRMESLPTRTATLLRHACEVSSSFASNFHLTVAIAYDGQTEIVDAVRSWLRSKATKGLTLEKLANRLTVQDISAHLYSRDQPHPDLVIRTGGDLRLSCFMPWQTIHSYFYFSTAYWPALTKSEFYRAIHRYSAAERSGEVKVRQLRVPNKKTSILGAMRLSPSEAPDSVENEPISKNRNSRHHPRHVAIALGSDLVTPLNADGFVECQHSKNNINVEELLSWCVQCEIETVTLGLIPADHVAHSSDRQRQILANLVAVIQGLSASQLKPRLRICGIPELLPEPAASLIAQAAAQTNGNSGLTTNIAVCYDGRCEVVEAIRSALVKHAAQGRSVEDMQSRLEVADVEEMLCAPYEPEVDLIIDISSHKALGGFLLWQAVRSEFWFWKGCGKFRQADLIAAVRDYGSRRRRFGA